LRRLFRVYAHIYYEHFDQICALGIEGQSPIHIYVTPGFKIDQVGLIAHLNTNYRHFYLFVTEVSPGIPPFNVCFMLLIITAILQFNLIDKRDMIPLAEFNDTIAGEYK
jgi:MOB kinase activator 1